MDAAGDGGRGGRHLLTYDNWGEHQPDGHQNENCAEIWTSGKWNDAPCKHEKAFVCSVPEPPQTLRFPCSADPSRQCTYDVFGADGKRASTLKQEFHGCQALCQAAHGQVAETRTAEQRSYLAQVLRQSGDVAMWLGLRPIAPTTWGPGTQGWTWMVSGANISKADERLFGPTRRAIASACGRRDVECRRVQRRPLGAGLPVRGGDAAVTGSGSEMRQNAQLACFS